MCLFLAPGLFNMSKQDSLNAEERIAQILRDAQNAMVHKNHEALHNNRTPQSQQSQHSSHSSSSNINNNNNVSWSNRHILAFTTDKSMLW